MPSKGGEQGRSFGGTAGTNGRQDIVVDGLHNGLRRAWGKPHDAPPAVPHKTLRHVFEAFHGVAIGPPYGAIGQCVRFFGRWCSHIAIEWVNADPKVCRQGPQQRGIVPLTISARYAGECYGKIGFLLACGGLPEDMQTVADLRLFQLAQVGVKLAQIGVAVAGEAHVPRQTRCVGQRQNLAPQVGNAPRIDAGGLVIFVDQGFQIAHRPIAFGAGQRRG